MRRICVVELGVRAVSETFLRIQAEALPADITVLQGCIPVALREKQPNRERMKRAIRRACRVVLRRPISWEITAGYLGAFQRWRPDAVLAQYGPTGVRVLDAALRADVPLVVHFHGYDATGRDLLQKHREGYRRLFEHAAGLVAVSRPMMRALVASGAPSKKVHYSPYGVDCVTLSGGNPANAPPTFVAVGRMVEKKAPVLTIKAFASILPRCPQARLRMVGDGPLLDECRGLVEELKVGHTVTFLGAQPHGVVVRELKSARAFVQHSREAPNGDCEGTPVAILEASASRLPVVATRHAGIVEAVVEGETGYLVDEGDVEGMATHMLRLAEDPRLAAQMGRAGRRHIEENYVLDKCIARLWAIIESCIEEHAAKRRRSNGRAAATPLARETV